jgi:hypothetical protein
MNLFEGGLSIAAASFSIYAFEALKKELEQVEELRFIFTSPTFIKDKSKKEKREFYIPRLNRERSLYGTDFEIRLRWRKRTISTHPKRGYPFTFLSFS